jgi:hypothetical protein
MGGSWLGSRALSGQILPDRTTRVDQPDRTLRLSLARKPDARPAEADLVGGAASHDARIVILLALETDPHFAPPLASAQRRRDHSDAASRADGWVLSIVHTQSLSARGGNDSAEGTPTDAAIGRSKGSTR